MMKDIVTKVRTLLAPSREKTILVIDDSELDRHLAVSILQKRFYVLTASDGMAGVRLARDKKPDLILLDFMMPGMTGSEVCRALKESVGTRDIPVIFLTSMDTPATVVDSFEQGAEIFLTKPVRSGELIRQIELTFQTALSVKESYAGS